VLGIVTSSSNPAVPGQQVTFTFTASPAPPSSAIPTGNVLVKVDGESTAVPLVNGVATFSTSTLSIGSHVVEAEYAGNANWIGTTNRLSPDQLVNVPSPQLDGVSGVTYRIDFSSADLTAWQTLGNATPEGGGSFELIDTPPPSSRQRFYRVVYP
jgi:hypothetical protein